MIKFEPIKDFMVLERASTKGSKIALPDASEPVSDDIFEVIRVGPGTEDYPMFLEPGDKICLTGYINTFSYKGERVVLGRARDVMALIKEDAVGKEKIVGGNIR
jgi:co-chaperonin GroES (HSP10)